MDDDPTPGDGATFDGVRWKALGREHGRRAIPADAGKPSVVNEKLQSILLRKVIGAWEAATTSLESIDGRRLALRLERARLATLPATSPPRGDALAAALAGVERELATQEIARKAANDRLDLAIRRLQQQAQEAEAVFREAYISRCGLKGAGPAPADLDVPDDLRGPVPDPLEDLDP